MPFRRLNKKSKKRLVRSFIVAANACLLIGVGVFVVEAQSTTPTNSTPVKSQLAGAGSVKAKPLDTLSSSDVAVHIARLTGIQEATAVVNQADTVNAQLAVAATDDQVAVKPQVVSGGLKSKKDIKTYTTVEGDTVTALAAKFGVSADTIRNSNGITGDTIPAGKQVKISPVNGIIYAVKSGDTPDNIASRYNANKDLLVAFNDAELTGGFVTGETIVIPDGVQPAAPTAGGARLASFATGGFAWGAQAVYGGSNAYAYGWCTWGVANLIDVPSNWGNASSWASAARLSGWTVTGTPRVGAIAQTSIGWGGHVGIVTAVSEDGTMIKYKDMNGLAGFGRYGETTDFVPAHGRFQNFIYR